MRLLSMLSCLCLSVSLATAEEPRLCVPASFLSPTMPEQVRLRLTQRIDEDLAHARRLRNAGIAITLLGATLTIIGIPLLLHAGQCDSCSSSFGTAGLDVSVIGPIALITGIPLWAVGQEHANRARRSRLALSMSGAKLTF